MLVGAKEDIVHPIPAQIVSWQVKVQGKTSAADVAFARISQYPIRTLHHRTSTTDSLRLSLLRCLTR